MDAFIIAKLEAVMLRSPISPYAVARFFIVGSGFAALATQATWITTQSSALDYAISVIFLLWIGASLKNDYWLTARVERENIAGFQNSLKVHSRRRRLSLALINALNLAFVVYDPELNSLTWMVFFLMELAYSYFQALNWSPPPGRAWFRLPRLAFGGAT